MDKELNKCTRIEEKGLKVMFGGYIKKELQLKEKFEDIMKEY